MKINRTNTLFKSTQQELYAAARLAYAACLENIDAFAGIKTKYTPGYVASMLAAISAAEALPDVHKRISIRSAARVRLIQCKDINLASWQALKSCIQEAWPDADMQQSMLSAAGASYYSKAATGNWSALRSLLNAGYAFITDNLDELIANYNMLPAFPAKYDLAREECNKLAHEYFVADAKKNIDTGGKLAANNAVYKSLMSMCKDGRRQFAKDEVLKKLFVYDELLSMIGKGKVAGMKILVKDSITSAPVQEVKVMCADDRYHGVTGKAGRLNINRMASGEYTFIFEKIGYNLFTRTITIHIGTTSRFTISLTKTVEVVQQKSTVTPPQQLEEAV